MPTSVRAQKFIIGLIVVVAGVLLVGSLFVVPVPEVNQRIIDLISGIVLGWGSTVVGFYFSDGTPHDSRDLLKRNEDQVES